MSGLRTDLLAKRVWMLVALLAVAIVVVLAVLRQASDSPAASAATPPVTVAAAPQAPVDAAARALGAGPAAAAGTETRDPFAQPRPQRPQSADAVSARAPAPPPARTPTPDPAPAAHEPAPAALKTASPTTVTPAPSTTPAKAPPARTFTLHHTDVQFGDAESDDIPRLLAFPNARTPAAQYLGVTGDGDHAAFAIGLNTTVTGAATCRPRKDLCTTLVLGRGERVTLTSAGFQVPLRLLRIRTTHTRSRAAALRFYARVSRAGRCLRNVADAFDYDRDHGLLASQHAARCRYTRSTSGLVGVR
jgi:hypothetical protein